MERTASLAGFSGFFPLFFPHCPQQLLGTLTFSCILPGSWYPPHSMPWSLGSTSELITLQKNNEATQGNISWKRRVEAAVLEGSRAEEQGREVLPNISPRHQHPPLWGGQAWKQHLATRIFGCATAHGAAGCDEGQEWGS